MRVRPLVPALLLVLLVASPAHAFFNPYVRIGVGGNQQKMEEANEAIAGEIAWASSGGLPVTAREVGRGYGPTVSAGVWLVPFVRVGATYSKQRANVTHEFHAYEFLYADNYHFHVEEIGVEAAIRIPALAGLTLGGGTGESRAEASETFSLDNVHGQYEEFWMAERTQRTYSAFVGLDQTLPNGLAGFVHLGYHWRDIGVMPGVMRVNDNGTVSESTGETVPMDYSGWSVKLGFGFDLIW